VSSLLVRAVLRMMLLGAHATFATNLWPIKSLHSSATASASAPPPPPLLQLEAEGGLCVTSSPSAQKHKELPRTAGLTTLPPGLAQMFSTRPAQLQQQQQNTSASSASASISSASISDTAAITSQPLQSENQVTAQDTVKPSSQARLMCTDCGKHRASWLNMVSEKG